MSGAGSGIDVFISYRRGQLGQEWIKSFFRPELDKYLELEINRKPKIFWDEESIDEGAIPRDEVLDSVRRARCAVALLSVGYFTSPWCTFEWQNFKTRHDQLGKPALFPLKWHDSEDYEKVFGDTAPKPSRFEKFCVTGPGWTRTEGYVDFQNAIARLASAISRSVPYSWNPDPSWTIVGDPRTTQPLKSNSGEWHYRLGSEGTNG